MQQTNQSAQCHNWDSFETFVFATPTVDVLETNPERTYIAVENMRDMTPHAIADLFHAADNAGATVGTPHWHRSNGRITFYR